VDISHLNIKSLKELIEKAESRITELHKTEAAQMRAKLVAMAKAEGYDAAALLGSPGKATKAAKATGDKVRRPAKAKYRNPNGPETWTGRGLKPLWLRAALEAGKSLDSMLIK
jgi:DNA-binding protein H-NS